MIHMTRWQVSAFGGGLAALAAAAVLWPNTTVGARTQAPSVRSDAAHVVSGALDPSVVSNARKYVGLSLADASLGDRASLLPTSESAALARADTYSRGGSLVRLSLVRATKAGSDNPASAALGLRHVNQLAWALEFANAKEPLFGPADGGAHTTPATLILLLDPADGSFISAAYY